MRGALISNPRQPRQAILALLLLLDEVGVVEVVLVLQPRDVALHQGAELKFRIFVVVEEHLGLDIIFPYGELVVADLNAVDVVVEIELGAVQQRFEDFDFVARILFAFAFGGTRG